MRNLTIAFLSLGSLFMGCTPTTTPAVVLTSTLESRLACQALVETVSCFYVEDADLGEMSQSGPYFAFGREACENVASKVCTSDELAAVREFSNCVKPACNNQVRDDFDELVSTCSQALLKKVNSTECNEFLAISQE